jgi:MFS family permease
MAIFLTGSMASGQARTMEQLIVFRALQGIGAGGMQPMATTIAGDIFKLEERAKMQGIFGAVWAIAGLVGPLVGGLIVATLSWRWVFYVNVPFGLLSAAVLTFSLVETIEPHEHRLDIAGAALLAGAVVTLLLGTDGVAPWVLLPASAALTAVFLAVEKRVAEPILPLALFARRILATSSALSALCGGAMVGLVTFVPLYAQGVLGSTPTEAGTTIATMAVAWPIASALSGRLIRRVGFRAGFLLIGASSLVLAIMVSRGTSAGMLRVAAALFGFGMGIANTPLVIAVQSSVGFSQRGVATASTMFFRNIGGTVAVGVMGVVLARSLLAGALVAGAGQDDRGGAALVARILGPERRSVQPAVLAAISGDLALGLSRVLWLVCGLAIAASAVAWLFPVVSTKDE